MEPYICIHGHFYQPPRENPWLEAIELQDSAHPFHDWNERITAECYAPNAASRIIGDDGRISAIVNNYARMSFNFGPTLLAWLQEHAPDAYAGIQGADRTSQSTFSGHGSALAQPFNHMIMPLANSRDKRTQVVWGVCDFSHRFGRSPEGMWLPETAVDLETLDLLAELGIRFTILAPHQAHRVRSVGSRTWQDVSGARIDPSMPYLLNLPSGRSINLFFYDGPVSRAVAFEGLLMDGRRFAERLLGSYAEGHNRGHLIHIATDGETYGHHHRFGDMALAYAFEHIASGSRARFTNYGEYLSRFPPTREVEIVEDTSWSCAHGIERWRSNCGCSTGGQPGWTQEWRAPLREAFDWLRDHLAPRYEAGALKLLKNPWAARDDYISVLLDRSSGSVSAFLRRHATHDLSESETVEALKLLELQRSAMLMYTSCGWFFNEISGIETVQCLQYAGRALQITQDLFGESLHVEFLRILERARSNIPEKRDGARIFAGSVLPAVVDPAKVGAHYAISSLFQPDGADRSVYCYDVHRLDYHSAHSGRSQLALGRATVASRVTREAADLAFGVLHVGDHNIIGGDRPFLDPDVYQSVVTEITEMYTSGDLLNVIRLLDKHFGGATYSLGSLFRDEQRAILNSILESALDDAEALNRQVYDHSAPMMRFVATLGHPRPAALHRAAELVLHADLRRLLTQDELDNERAQSILAEAARLGVVFDSSELGFIFKQRLLGSARMLEANPGEVALLHRLADAVKLARALPFPVDLWEVQNIYWTLLHTVYPEVRERAAQENKLAREWAAPFLALGDVLGVQVPA